MDRRRCCRADGPRNCRCGGELPRPPDAAIDRTCSRFREGSDLSRVNAARGHRVVVDPLLVEALVAALRAARLTDGDVDPTIGGALVLAG